MLTIEQLASFKAAYEMNSYSAAGRMINKDRATVREHVIGLEIDIGKTLFTVKGKRLEPSPAAIQLYSKAKHIIKQVADFEHSARMMYDTDLTELTILHETVLPTAFLCAIEQSIASRYQGLKLRLLHKNRLESLRLLEEGEAHFAILANQGQAFPNEKVEVTYLGVSLFSAYAHPSSSLFLNPAVSLLDLTEEMQFVSENIDVLPLNAMKHSNSHCVVSNTDLIVELLQYGGWSALNRLDAARYEKAGWVKELPLKELTRPYSVGIAFFQTYALQSNQTITDIKQLIVSQAKDYLTEKGHFC
ncbi:putative LysR family transcriptional regulator [Vibrio crassostreae]|uniref:Putative LysR family transcriptional regulator n=1 Tax=Vibrio crassostreae TaxID=246167 RepID=A0A822MYY6_9VIBR|nr:LysR family transcriptional regulator [Vibrio crassostreae]MDH5949686.1 LysR family transcriptional regulator [Vibrio crassostreae]ROO49088.1 DNA-binding transcriptional LysR family regulator [Vibrio crassostreae]ROO71949.1 DNA-binding transcriptional LysR family regulator [Vibrio crassostreae]ROO73161.1 DNA-binding transcriptional LysR family regulator [Vibrio crassostreae]ROP22172.1 DNA-binding transcriptional LysR family regulator [Vibrio crassostreae]